jgi:hypothetical protein
MKLDDGRVVPAFSGPNCEGAMTVFGDDLNAQLLLRQRYGRWLIPPDAIRRALSVSIEIRGN